MSGQSGTCWPTNHTLAARIWEKPDHYFAQKPRMNRMQIAAYRKSGRNRFVKLEDLFDHHRCGPKSRISLSRGETLEYDAAFHGLTMTLIDWRSFIAR